MCEEVGLKKTESSSGRVLMRRLRVAAAMQYAMFLAMAVTALLALFYDSRLYYGIDANGQPIYPEVTCPAVLHAAPASADFATRIDIERTDG